MTAGVFGNELDQFQQAFNAIDTSDQQPVKKKEWTPPFRIHEKSEALITTSELSRPPWEGDDGVYLHIELTHPENDQTVDMYLPLTPKSDRQALHVKKTLKTLGYDLDDGEKTLSGLEDHGPEFEGLRVEIYTKPYASAGRTRYNYYINHIIEDSSSSAVDDDIPF